MRMNGRTTDLSGKEFGLLKVIEFVGYFPEKRSRIAYWRCRCVCGNEKTMSVNQLIGYKVKSCGCLKRIHGRKKDWVFTQAYLIEVCRLIAERNQDG